MAYGDDAKAAERVERFWYWSFWAVIAASDVLGMYLAY